MSVSDKGRSCVIKTFSHLQGSLSQAEAIRTFVPPEKMRVLPYKRPDNREGEDCGSQDFDKDAAALINVFIS